MNTDHGPDTIQIDDDPTRWAATQVDDVFDPALRVSLGWHDVENAVERGAVLPAQAHALWAGWASQSSAQRMAAAPTAGHAAPKPVAPLSVGPLEAAEAQHASLGGQLVFGLAAALIGALGGAVLSYLVLVR